MYLFFRKLVEIYTRLKYHLVIHGLENKPELKGGYIVACNHQTYADPPTIAAMIRGHFSFMAKSELFEKNVFFAWLIRRCGAFPVHRGAGDNAALERAESDIKKGKIFIIFPEGTRSTDGVIGRGKSGCALIASQVNAPVLPVCIMYGEKGDKKRLDFAFGKLIPAEELKINTDDRRALRGVTKRIMQGILDCQAEILGGEPKKREGAETDNDE